MDVTGKEPVPGECPHERLVEFDGTKSFCALLGAGTWTNCRQRGRCTLWRLAKEPVGKEGCDERVRE